MTEERPADHLDDEVSRDVIEVEPVEVREDQKGHGRDLDLLERVAAVVDGLFEDDEDPTEPLAKGRLSP